MHRGEAIHYPLWVLGDLSGINLPRDIGLLWYQFGNSTDFMTP